MNMAVLKSVDQEINLYNSLSYPPDPLAGNEPRVACAARTRNISKTRI